MNEKQFFSTRDKSEAAALLSVGIPLEKLDRVNGIFWFSFSEIEHCQEVINQFWLGELEVKAKTFSDAEKRLVHLMRGCVQ